MDGSCAYEYGRFTYIYHTNPPKERCFFNIWAHHPIIPKLMVYLLYLPIIWFIFMVNVHVGNNMTYIKCLGIGPLLANSPSSFAVHQVRQKK